ncbi:hypothetical protein HHI36_013149 [Cryptolaemus montrouzieri]|uniref:Uncharacterized protein n=1 Tax=Cryptolaemus montrouzieri TaxID=559131 RepID=A0ABD2NGG9_9CUCU
MVESIDNDFPGSYPEHNKKISTNHFDPESSAVYDSHLETNDNENHSSYIEEENATLSYHLEIESSSSAFPPSASPTPEGTDDIFSVSCNSRNPTVLHLTRLKNVNYNVSPIPSNESDNDEDVDDSGAIRNFGSRSHQSSSRSSVRSQNESSVQSEVELEGKKGEEVENKCKKRKSNPENWITKKAKLLRNWGKAETKKSIAAKKLK